MSSRNANPALTQQLSSRFSTWLDRRIPASKNITLNQRSIFILPSKLGGAFFLLITLLLFAAINYQNSLIYATAFILISTTLVTIFHTYKNLAGLRFELVKSGSGFVGENIEFQIKVSKPNEDVRDDIRLKWPNSLTQYAHLHETSEDIVTLFSSAKRRGWFNPGRILIETHYPIGLIRAWTWVDLDTHGIVYPKPLFGDALTNSDGAEESNALLDLQRNDDFYQMRNYHEGDPIKHISWRSYARNDELLVKEFAGYQGTDIILDWYQLDGDIEFKLSRLTGMALTAHRNQIEFGLRLPGNDIPCGSGDAHLNTVLRQLALYVQ